MSVSWMSLLSGEGALCLGVLESAEVSVTGPSCGAWLLVKSAFPPGIRDSTGWGGQLGTGQQRFIQFTSNTVFLIECVCN